MELVYAFGVLIVLVSLRAIPVKLVESVSLEPCYSVDTSKGISNDITISVKCEAYNYTNTMTVLWTIDNSQVFHIRQYLIGYQCYSIPKNLSVLEDYTVISDLNPFTYYETTTNEMNCTARGCLERYLLGLGYTWIKLNTVSCHFDTPPTVPVDITATVTEINETISTTTVVTSSSSVNSSTTNYLSPSTIYTASDSFSSIILNNSSSSLPLSLSNHATSSTIISSSVHKYISNSITKSSSNSAGVEFINTSSRRTTAFIADDGKSTTNKQLSSSSGIGSTSVGAAPPTTDQSLSPELNIIVVIVVLILLCAIIVAVGGVMMIPIARFHRKLYIMSNRKSTAAVEVDIVPSTAFQVIAYSLPNTGGGTVSESPSLVTVIQEPADIVQTTATVFCDSHSAYELRTDPVRPPAGSFTPPRARSASVILLDRGRSLQTDKSLTCTNDNDPCHSTGTGTCISDYPSTEDNTSFMVTVGSTTPTQLPLSNAGSAGEEPPLDAADYSIDSPYDSVFLPEPLSSSDGKYISDGYDINYISRIDSSSSDAGYHSSYRSSSLYSGYVHCSNNNNT